MGKTVLRFEDIKDKDYGTLTSEGVCTKCGRPVGPGEYPFCPHGTPLGAILRDEIPGGVTVENYGPHPITFYSHSERRAYMRAHGLVEKENFAPLPGTDRDAQGIPNPNGYRDLSAASLIARNGRRDVADDPGRVGGPDYDPSNVFDIPNDPSLAPRGAFSDVQILTNRQARKWMESV